MLQDTGSKGAREGSSTSTGGRAGRGNGRPGGLPLDGRPLGQTRQPRAARALRGMVVSSTDACQQPQREGQWQGHPHPSRLPSSCRATFCPVNPHFAKAGQNSCLLVPPGTLTDSTSMIPFALNNTAQRHIKQKLHKPQDKWINPQELHGL